MPSATTGPTCAWAPRGDVITVVVIIRSWPSTSAGIKQSALAVNLLTMGKLPPLVLFILMGLPYVSFDALRPDEAVTWAQMSTSALYLIFAYGGYEVIPVPAGETRIRGARCRLR